MATPDQPKKRRPGRPKLGDEKPIEPNLDIKAAERKAKTTKKLGRPTTLDGRLYTIIVKMVGQGKTYEEIGDVIGISRQTINWWVQTNPNLKADVNMARALCDEIVEAALFQSAVGFSHEEEKIFCTKGGRIVRAKTRKQYQPSVDAAKFWLTNRKPETWSHKERPPADSTVTVNLAYNPNKRLVEDEANGHNGSEETGPTEETGS